jgi:hypothetical protein
LTMMLAASSICPMATEARCHCRADGSDGDDCLACPTLAPVKTGGNSHGSNACYSEHAPDSSNSSRALGHLTRQDQYQRGISEARTIGGIIPLITVRTPASTVSPQSTLMLRACCYCCWGFGCRAYANFYCQCCMV